MTHPQRKTPARRRAPAVGFVSLGCPKALIDSERLITELKCRGYAIAAGYADADLVVVNTCGFIDAAIDESLQAIGEALQHNGRVLVTDFAGQTVATIGGTYMTRPSARWNITRSP